MRWNLRQTGALYNFLQMAACVEQQNRSEITDWQNWSKAVSEMQHYLQEGKPLSSVAERYPACAKFVILLQPAAQLAEAEIAEAREAYRLALKAAQAEHERKVAQAAHALLVSTRKARANRRKAKYARNRVFKRFLETGNEQQAIEELRSIIGCTGLENVS